MLHILAVLNSTHTLHLCLAIAYASGTLNICVVSARQSSLAEIFQEKDGRGEKQKRQNDESYLQQFQRLWEFPLLLRGRAGQPLLQVVVVSIFLKYFV